MELTLRTSRTAPALPEDVLVAAARQEDDQAFEELYARYRQRIFAFILSKVRDHGRAEDIAQEVFMSALRRLRASDQQISFKPWIYEIAKNACIDEFRRGSRSREIPLETDEEIAGRRPMMSVVPTPTDAVENRQRLDDLRGAFGGLSGSHHQLLVLREFEGLSYDEIGARLGMTRQMVESGLFRARRKLTEEYDDLASGRRCTQIQTAIDSGSAQSINSLGVRERRRIARHLSHCQSCRHVALVAGVDEALLKPKSIAAKLAGLLPFPVWRWLRSGARAVHPAGSSVSFGQAAVAVATLALAGAGTGLVVGLNRPHASGSSSATLAAAVVNPSRGSTTTAARPATSWPATATTASARSAVARFLAFEPAGVLFTPVQVVAPSTTSQGHRVAPSSPGTPLIPLANGPAGTNPLDAVTASGQSLPLSKLGEAVSGAKQTLHSTLGGVKSTVGSTLGGVQKVVGSTTSGVTKTVSTVTSGVDGAAGSAVSGATGSAGSASSSPSTGSAKSGGSSSSQSAGGSRPATSPGAGSALKTVGAKLTGAGASSSSSSAHSGPVSAVLAPVKSTVSGVIGK